MMLAIALSSPARADSKDEIATLTQEWIEAFAEHNVNRIIALYSKDALLWGTNGLTLRTTPEEVRGFFESAFGIPNIEVRFDNQTVRVFGDVAIAAGNYTFTGGGGDSRQDRPARYSFTFAKQDGRWLIVDHNSSLMPTLCGVAPTRRT